MAALPGGRGKSQGSLPLAALTPVSVAVLLASPARHITLQGSALAGLKLKILQEARTEQELLPKECFYLCPADPPAFPALGQEEPGNKEGEKG